MWCTCPPHVPAAPTTTRTPGTSFHVRAENFCLEYATVLKALVESSTHAHLPKDPLKVALTCWHALEFADGVSLSHGILAGRLGAAASACAPEAHAPHEPRRVSRTSS